MNSPTTMTKPQITLRPGRPEDAAELGKICFEAFAAIADQHNFPHDFPNAEVGIGFMNMLFSRPDCYSVVAEYEGKIAGSNFLWEGDAVKGVQEEFQFRNLSDDPSKGLRIDGMFGPATEASVRGFQQALSLDIPSVTVDGIVGPITWQALVSGMLSF